MLEISPTSPAPINLDKPGNISAPQENIEHFQRLMSGLGKSLNKGTPGFESRPAGETTEPPPPLLAKTAIELQKAEFNISRLQRHLTGGIQQLEGGHTMDGNFPRAVVQQQFSSAYYFLGVNRVGNTANDISEEIATVTKGR